MTNITQQARQATIGNILKKIKAGKVPTNREQEMLEEWERSQQATSENTFDLDTTTIASFFEVTAKTIASWAKQGMPKESYGIYNLKKCFDWWCDNIEATKEDRDPTITALRAENLRIKNERESMKRDTEKGLLLPRSDLLPEWVKVYREFCQGLMGLGNKLPPLLEGLSQEEIQVVLSSNHKELLRALARPGKYRPDPRKKARK